MTLERFERCEHGTPEFEACGICTIKEWNMDKKRSRQDWAQQIAFGMRDGAELSSEDCKQLFEILTAMPSARPEKGELEAMADQLHMAYGDMPKDRPPGPPTSIVARLRELASVSATALPTGPDPLTLELAEELFGCFITPAAPDEDHSYECAVCEKPVLMRAWVTSTHAEDCAVAKAREYLAQHKPDRVPGYVRATDGGTHG